ncbi:MAG: acyltransferase [Dokdonella sp.]|uniref:acyltransferase family protein n=1 Tax=Dokdonella sp. TaxID=2291710 RepID=UPI0032679CAE
MKAVAPDSRVHVDALDGLRGIAILLVLAHGFDVVGDSHGVVHHVGELMDVGWIGVQLFFVLSGFLITGILLDTRSNAHYYRSFFVRRVLRIFPLYYGVLLVAFVLLPMIIDTGDSGRHQIWLWTYLANYVAPFGREEPAFPHFWSLCVEEQFYLVWPLVVRLTGRRGVVAISLALIAIAMATRIALRQHFGDPVGIEAAYMFTPSRMDALAIGALIAALLREPRNASWMMARDPRSLALAGGALLGASLVLGHLQRTGAVMQTFGYTLVAAAFGLILCALLQKGTPSRWIGAAPLRRCGLYSYGMYVFYAPLHLFVGLPLLTRLAGPTPSGISALTYMIVATAATFALAALSYHAYERRFLALKPRLAPQPVQA